MSTSVKPEAAGASISPSQAQIKEEADFVNAFSTKLEKGELPADRGRAKAEREVKEAAKETKPATGKTTEAAKPDKPETDKPDDEGTRAGADKGADDVDEVGDDDTDNGGKKDDSAADDDTDKPDDDKADDADKVDDDKKDDDVDDEDVPEDKLAEEARGELAKHGLKVSLKDLPAEARPLVQKTLDHATAALTRALQEARSYRAEQRQFLAERAFAEQNPEVMIAEMLLKGGEQLDTKINAILAELTTDNAKKAFEVTTRDTRAKVLEQIDAASAQTEQTLQNADKVESYLRTACTKLGLDFDLVIDSAINKLNDKPDAEKVKGLTESEMDAIIGRHDRALRRMNGGRRLQQRKEEIQGRGRDKRITSPAARSAPGTTTPGAVGKKQPTTDAEFVEYMTAKLSGGRR